MIAAKHKQFNKVCLVNSMTVKIQVGGVAKIDLLVL